MFNYQEIVKNKNVNKLKKKTTLLSSSFRNYIKISYQTIELKRSTRAYVYLKRILKIKLLFKYKILNQISFIIGLFMNIVRFHYKQINK